MMNFTQEIINIVARTPPVGVVDDYMHWVDLGVLVVVLIIAIVIFWNAQRWW